MKHESSNLLRNIHFFEGLTDKKEASLLDNAVDRTYSTGEIIIQEGSVGQAFYLVLSGSVKITKEISGENEEDRQIIIGVRKCGDIFGEMALIDHKARSARVTVVSPARILTFRRNDFDKLTHYYPAFMLKIMKIMSQRLRESDNHQVDEFEERNKQLQKLNRLQEKRINILQKQLQDKEDELQRLKRHRHNF